MLLSSMEKKLRAGALGVEAFEKSANEKAAPDKAIDLRTSLLFIYKAYLSIRSTIKTNQIQQVFKEIGSLDKLADFDLSTKEVIDQSNERYKGKIPYQELVISPAKMFNSDRLFTIE